MMMMINIYLQICLEQCKHIEIKNKGKVGRCIKEKIAISNNFDENDESDYWWISLKILNKIFDE